MRWPYGDGCIPCTLYMTRFPLCGRSRPTTFACSARRCQPLATTARKSTASSLKLGFISRSMGSHLGDSWWWLQTWAVRRLQHAVGAADSGRIRASPARTRVFRGRRVRPVIARAGIMPQCQYEAPASLDGVSRLLLHLAQDVLEDYIAARIGACIWFPRVLTASAILRRCVPACSLSSRCMRAPRYGAHPTSLPITWLRSRCGSSCTFRCTRCYWTHWRPNTVCASPPPKPPYSGSTRPRNTPHDN